MESGLKELLLESTLEPDAVTEFTRLGIVSLELFTAVPDEKSLQSMIIDRIKWSGDADKHMAKGLGVHLAYSKARERAACKAQGDAKRAASGEPPDMGDTVRMGKLLEYRKRNNSAANEKRPDNKLWDHVAVCKSSNFLPYIPLEKIVTFNESAQRTKKITKEEDGVEREKDITKDRPPKGLWDIKRRITILAVVADLEWGAQTGATNAGGDRHSGEVRDVVEKYNDHLMEIGQSNPRPTLRQILWADKLARQKWAESTQSGGLSFVQAVERTISDGNLWNSQMYRVPDDEFVEHDTKDTKRRRLEESTNTGSSGANQGGGKKRDGKGGSAKGGKSSGSTFRVCYAYNEGNCRGSKCPMGFSHVCWSCGEQHPACDRASCRR